MIAVALLATAMAQAAPDAYDRFVNLLTKAETVFTQEISFHEVRGQKVKIESRLWYARPNLCRFETYTNGTLAYQIVGDGTNCWSWDPNAKRLEKYTLPGFPVEDWVTSPFLRKPEPKFGRTGDPIQSIKVAGRQINRVRLKPRKGNRAFDLDLDAKTDLPVAFNWVDESSRAMAGEDYPTIRINPKLDPNLFVYKPEVKPNAWDPMDYMLKVGSKAPDFTGKLFGEPGTVRLKDILKTHKYVFINLLRQGCVPCWDQLKKEFPDFAATYAPKGLKVLAIAQGTAKNLPMWVGDKALSIPVLIGDSSRVDIFTAYRAELSATEYLIDSKGIIRARFSGAEIADIKKDLAKLGIE